MFFEEVRGESESLGGLILELHGAMPKVNDTIIFNEFDFTITEVEQKRINKIKITINEKVKQHE